MSELVRTCAGDLCERHDMAGRGYCSLHYQRWQKYGDANYVKPIEPPRKCLADKCVRILGHGVRSYRGLCGLHYQRLMIHGDVLSDQPEKGTVPVEARIWAKVDTDGPIPSYNPSLGPCWIWTGHRTSGGYGRFFKVIEGVTRGRPAHRLVYEMCTANTVQGDLEMDHLCRVHECVNPFHLEPVTTKVNQHRGFGFAGINIRKTHCPAGHEYTDDNSYAWKPGMRRCRICNAATAQRYRTARKLRAA